MIAGRGVADERAVHRCGSGKNFAGRNVRPIARADEPAGLHPVDAAVEMRRDLRSRFGLYGEGFGAQHAFTQAVAQAVHHAVIRAHALLHDLWRDPDHVRVTNLAAFDHSHYGHARTYNSSPGSGLMHITPPSAVSNAP